MPRSLWWITTLTALLWTNSLLGAVSAQFPSPPSSDTIYDYWYGYPYMEVGGDNVLGYRSSSGLPAVNALSVEVGVDQTYLYCDTYLDFYFDGDYIGYAYLDPLYYWTQITDSITVDLTNAASHTVQMVLYWDADWCSYPYYYSWIELDDVYSTITMDLVGADSDGDGYYATTYYGDDCNDNDASVHPGASESCNGADDDCDGSVDENVQSVYYRDADGDGYGSAGTTTYACSAPPGYVSGAGDCNDQASGINPGAAEVCNGVDDDCDDKVDEGVKTTYYRDQDGDNYGSSSGTTQACSQPSGYSSASGDCNDTDSAIHPGASESCDGQDNDCDGSVDEGVQTTFYRDADEDGFGTTSQTTLACVAPAGYTNQPGDCDDSSATTYPSAPERCDGADNDCDGLTDEGVLLIWYPDSDGDGYGVVSQTQAGCSQPDGYSAQSGDCNDDVATVYPGATEVCNGVDDDCDDGQAGGGVDEGVKETFYQDGDGDGHGDSSQTAQACSSPEGYVITSDDCDDGDSGVHPGASEVCDGKDNDCDGTTDEGVQLTWYEDNDEDGFGSSQTTSACTQPSGYADSSGDCDDDDPLVNPAGTEVCNSKDDDCDDGQPGGGVDEGVKETWYQDADDDGYGTGVTALACSAPAGFAGSSGDCNDDDPLVNPSAVEVCNGVDDDCDGATDEGLLSTYYEDGDDDGYGTASSTVQACSPPAGFVATAGDCDDTSAGINPGAEEICDSTPGSPGIDNDCDGAIDEGVQSSYYQDFDGDGYGVGSVVQLACTVPDGHAERSGDCNDSDPGINPAAEETCDGRDNNCNGATDEGVTNTFYADADQDGFGDPLRPANACSVPSGYVVVDSPDAFDCNDVDATTYPGAQEVCDGRDNDCDGDIDEEARIPYYQDDDGDNYGATDQVVYACERPAGYAADGSDCDDNDPSVHPGAREDCDGRDNDCDGMVDEDVTSVFYADRDGDGHGTPDDSVRTCTRPDGYVSSG